MKKLELEQMEQLQGGIAKIDNEAACGIGIGIGLAVGGPAGLMVAFGMCFLA